MNTNNRILWGILLLAITGVILTGLGVRSSPAILSLPMLGKVPSFQLTDETGRAFPSGLLKNHVWIADFIFTSCGGQCPRMTEKMRLLQRRLPRRIHLVSISVDPTRDTPEVLEAYARHARAQEGRWHFLTGSPETIGPLAQEGFLLSAVPSGGSDSQADGGNYLEPITHSSRLVLVDQNGEIRGYYNSDDPNALAQLIREAAYLAR